MFEGFEARHLAAIGADIYLRIGGGGPPVLLLHGYPQTHVCWHHVAPALAERLVELIKGLNKLDLVTLITESDETYSKFINAKIVKLERGKIIS